MDKPYGIYGQDAQVTREPIVSPGWAPGRVGRENKGRRKLFPVIWMGASLF